MIFSTAAGFALSNLLHHAIKTKELKSKIALSLYNYFLPDNDVYKNVAL
jgi:hypothetical protein